VYLFIVSLHVLLCLLLVLIIVLQPGKGSDVGAAFGGGASNTIFGPRGPTGLLQRATTVVAVMFMGTSLLLAIYSNRGLMEDADVDSAIQMKLRERAEEKAKSTGEAPVLPDEAPAPAIGPRGR
jgi:preprotein translocase subunit SecG